MATSTLKFYKVAFPGDTNAFVEDLENYLGQLTAYEITGFQYQRNGLSLAVKLDLDQDEIDSFDYNYCRIVNSDDASSIYYYYITGKDQVAQSTVKISLAMDTVNTLGQGDSSPCNPKNFQPTTNITRQHQDRFRKTSSYDKDQVNLLWRNIDKNKEGVPITQVKSEDTVIHDGEDDQNWYLIYRSDEVADENKPVSVYLCADNDLLYKKQSDAKVITPSELGSSVYMILPQDNASWEVIISGNTYNSGRTFRKPGSYTKVSGSTLFTAYDAFQDEVVGLVYKVDPNDNTKILLKFIFKETFQAFETKRWGSDDTYTNGTQYNANTVEQWFSVSSFTVNECDYIRVAPSVTEEASAGELYAQNYPRRDLYAGTADTYIENIKLQDRTDSTLLKIIQLPYCPIEYTVDEDGVYTFPDDWVLDTGILKYNKHDLPSFGRELDAAILAECYIVLDNLDVGTKKTPSQRFESKLYSDEFHTTKLVYDSFSEPISLESFTPDDLSTTVRAIGGKVKYKPASTINSRIGFMADVSDEGSFNDREDFDQLLLTARNNEEMIYSSAYLNYLDYGKAIDEKANALAMKQARISAGFQVAGAALSLGVGFGGFLRNSRAAKLRADELSGSYLKSQNVQYVEGLGSTYNQAVQYARRQELWGRVDVNDPDWSKSIAATSFLNNAKLAGLSESNIATQQFAGMLGNAAGAVASLVNLSTLGEQQRNAVQAKEAELQHQSTSTSGSNDIDLFNWYSGNKLHLMKYNPDYAIRGQLHVLFHLYGYSHPFYEKPDVDSRYWFNYIQCDPAISYEGVKKYRSDFIADLKDKYNAGVTVFHGHYDSLLPVDEQWDFDRQYENWETWIIEGV